MVRDFRIGILKYLRDREADTTVIDIKTPFMLELGTPDRRKDFKKALDTLTTEKLIIVTGSYDFLNWKLLDTIYPIDDKIIEARLTAKGVTYEHPPEPVHKIYQPDEPLDLPLPPPVEALGRMLKGNKTKNEQLKRKMKKMGATDAHLILKHEEQNAAPVYYATPHVSVVPNPFTRIADDLVAKNREESSDLNGLSTISLKKPDAGSKSGKINTILKWAVIVVMIILAILVAKIFKDNS